MPESPRLPEDLVSSPFTVSEDADNSLQPFFVLHKALPRNPDKKASASGKPRRKSSRSSPTSPIEVSFGEPSNSYYEQLRLEAFNRIWFHIQSTIEEVLRDINLKLFNEVLQWAQESFSSIKSGVTLLSPSQIQQPYPLVTDTISRKIPTAFILTKNAEFVDDIQTFQDLGMHLKSNGCHVANVSALDFSVKHGIAGCIRSLLRQLHSEAPDSADISILATWYCEEENYDKPIVLIIDDMERCSGSVLGKFIMMLREWAIKIPMLIVMGIATTIGAPKKLLSSDTLQQLIPSKLTLGSPSDRMNALVESVIIKLPSCFSIAHGVSLFLRNYFLKHDGTLTSFISALKLACSKHFSMEPLSFLCLGISEDYSQGKFDSLPETIQNHAFNLPSCKRRKDLQENGINIINKLSEIKLSQRYWSSTVSCLIDAGRQGKIQMQLLDLFVEAIDPHNYINGDNKLKKGGLISQVIHIVREMPVAALSSLLDKWSAHTKGMPEMNEKVKDLQSVLASTDASQIYLEKLPDIRKRSASKGVGKGMPLNDKVATLLDFMVRKYMIPIEALPFHEIVCFKHVDILQSALIGDPRRTIQLDLLKSQKYLNCHCCCSRDAKSVSSSIHDTSIMYNIAQEYGDVINLHDWYQSFNSIVNPRPKKKSHNNSPASKKLKPARPLESEAMIQARFCRAITELQITGLLRMSSKRRPDFVQRIAFGI